MTPARPVLLDPNGAPMLTLWPLVQVASPTPGAEPELFFIDGPSRNGARLLALPSGYVHHDDELWSWFHDNGLLAEGGSAPLEIQERSPYPGLSAFTTEDASYFFGRERESEVALNRLRTQPFLAVVGPSGAGKSSFVHAGVVPLLANGSRTIYLRPGPTPIATLAARLAAEAVQSDDLAGLLARDPRALGALLRGLSVGGAQVVLFVDQFEEVFTLGIDAAERDRYVNMLCEAAREASEPVRVIITLRDDFLIRAQEQPAMRDPLAAGLQLLATPMPADLLRILVEPARRLGYSFEDESLAEEMVVSVAAEPSALPLLSFTAERLWEQRDRHFKQLTRKTYSALGGVGGALARHAEELLASMSAEEARLVREAFRHLVTADGTRAVLRRSELLELLGGGRLAEGVLEKLIGARLAVAQEGEQGAERIEIAHEALVQAWPRLRAWRQEDAEGARLRDQLRAAARQWVERGRAEGLLWRGEALTELTLWRTRHGRALTSAEAAFADTSVAEGARTRRIRRRLVVSAFAVLSCGLVALGVLGQRARRSAAEARARVLDLYEEEGRRLVLADDPVRALAYLQEAWTGGRHTTLTGGVIGQALDMLAPLERTYGRHQGRVYSAVRTRDGRSLVTAGEDGTIKVWDAERATLTRTITGTGGPIVRVELDVDGHVVAGATGGQIGVWDLDTGARLRTLDAHVGTALLARLAPDRRHVAQLTPEEILIWRLGDGALVHRFAPGGGVLRNAFFTPDGTALVVTDETGGLMLWSSVTGQRLRSLPAHAAPVLRVSFSADGARLVTASEDGTAKIITVATGAVEHVLRGHTQKVLDARLSPDGRRVVTASGDRTARLWDVETGEVSAVLEGHRGALIDAYFSPDGAQVITSSGDGSARVWDVEAGRAVVSLIGHLGAISIAAFDGKQAITVGADGTARAWAIDRGARELVLRGHRGEVRTAELMGDGQRLATESSDGTVRLWDAARGTLLETVSRDTGPTGAMWWSHDVATIAWSKGGNEVFVTERTSGRERFVLRGHAAPVESLAFSLDGSLIATGGQGQELRVWDGRTGAQRWAGRARADTVVALDVSADGRFVASANSDGTAELWDAHAGTLLRTLVGHRGGVSSIVFDQDGRRLLTTGLDRSAKVWTVASGALEVSLDDHPDAVWSGAFVPGTRLVATAGWDGAVRLWDSTSARLIAEYRGHHGPVLSVSASKDAHHVLSAGGDGIAILWRIPTAYSGDPGEVSRRLVGLDRYRLESGRALLGP